MSNNFVHVPYWSEMTWPQKARHIYRNFRCRYLHSRWKFRNIMPDWSVTYWLFGIDDSIVPGLRDWKRGDVIRLTNNVTLAGSITESHVDEDGTLVVDGFQVLSASIVNRENR